MTEITILVINAMALAFKNYIITINLITIIVFLNKIDKIIFNHVFKIISIKNELFGSRLIYFRIVKTNNLSIFHFYYLVWLKKIYNFFNIYKKMHNKNIVVFCFI